MKPHVLLVCWFALMGAGPAWQSPQQVPTFRSGVDVVQLDVSVLDGRRRPVRGLTAADFTVTENGVTRPIVAFTGVDLPVHSTKTPGFGPVAPDVSTNALPEGRLIIIMLDRSTVTGGPAVMARKIALGAVDALGPGDLAAVVHTARGRPQNFTADRARLIAAIDSARFDIGTIGGGDSFERGECQCGVCSLDAISTAAEAVRDEPHRRKTLLFIGASTPITIAPGSRCYDIVDGPRNDMLRAAQNSNLSVHALDPNGLQTSSVSAEFGSRGMSPAAREAMNRARIISSQESLRELADQTGGRAVLNTNAPTDSIRAILDETSSYYLLAIQTPGHRDDRFHPITVRVNRPDVEVRTRRGYYAKQQPAPAGGSPLTVEALGGDLLPTSGLGLTLSATPFALPGSTRAAILVAVGVREQQPSVATQADATGSRTKVESDVLVSAFFAPKGSEWHRQQLVLLASSELPPDQPQYEALSRVDVAPGRYTLRAGVHHRGSGRLGTVHADVDVPDFSADRLSLSGIVIHHGTPLNATPEKMLGGLIPVVPTTRRTFSPTDRVSAFVRVYQQRTGDAGDVGLVFRLQNASGVEVTALPTPLKAAAFDPGRSADARFDLPLHILPAGDYLLTVAATRDKTTIRRDIRFTVR